KRLKRGVYKTDSKPPIPTSNRFAVLDDLVSTAIDDATFSYKVDLVGDVISEVISKHVACIKDKAPVKRKTQPKTKSQKQSTVIITTRKADILFERSSLKAADLAGKHDVRDTDLIELADGARWNQIALRALQTGLANLQLIGNICASHYNWRQAATPLSYAELYWKSPNIVIDGNDPTYSLDPEWTVPVAYDKTAEL
ncbi:hypothetical protein HK101_003919, partial [Irineochytrium annulatum]